MDLLCFCSVLCLLCLCARLVICALWSPAGKGLTSWLSPVVSNCEVVTFPLVSWVRCGTWLYRFLIFAPLLTLTLASQKQFYINSYTSDFFNSERFSPFLWFLSKCAFVFSNIDSSYCSEIVLARIASSKGSKLLPPCRGSKICVYVLAISSYNCLYCLFVILIWFYLQIYFCLFYLSNYFSNKLAIAVYIKAKSLFVSQAISRSVCVSATFFLTNFSFHQFLYQIISYCVMFILRDFERHS